MGEQSSAGTPEAPSGKHHEKAVVITLVTVAVVVVLGLLLANWVLNLLKPNSSQPDVNLRLYNGFQFQQSGNAWVTRWKGSGGQEYILEFRHPPWDVDDVTVTGKLDYRFQSSGMYITHDPRNESTSNNAWIALAASDLTVMLKNVFEREIVLAACTKNLTESCFNRPIVTCATNASVVYIRDAPEPAILLDGNCVTIEGQGDGLTRAADKALYEWLHIIK